MSKTVAQFTIEGEEKLFMRLKPSIARAPIHKFFTKWGVFTQSRARLKAPVNRNRLRSSIKYEIDEISPIPTECIVGTNDRTGIFMEGGTGLQADLPGGTNRRHYPPAKALEPWAKKHGTTGKRVAFLIGRRGGLRPRRFLRDSFDDSKPRIDGWLKTCARDIEKANEHGSN